MADKQTKIEIPERLEDEADATSEQLQFIRQLIGGMSLQGFRFDYRKLGKWQASAVIDQLLALNKEASEPTPTKPRKQGPGCIASFAKGTTALIFWAVVLAGVAGGGYLIYWWMNKNPQTAQNTAENPSEDGSSNPADTPTGSPDGSARESSIFEGLGASDPPRGQADNTPDQPDTPTQPDTNPTPEPETPDTTVDRAATMQLVELEQMLVKLSQFTRNDFAADVRAQSSDAMQRRLDGFSAALAALDKTDATLSSRIRAVVEAFAAAEVDGPALREEIKAIRKAIDALK